MFVNQQVKKEGIIDPDDYEEIGLLLLRGPSRVCYFEDLF